MIIILYLCVAGGVVSVLMFFFVFSINKKQFMISLILQLCYNMQLVHSSIPMKLHPGLPIHSNFSGKCSENPAFAIFFYNARPFRNFYTYPTDQIACTDNLQTIFHDFFTVFVYVSEKKK
jgi:hypothetical protein